jgi:hypothetical protein
LQRLDFLVEEPESFLRNFGAIEFELNRRRQSSLDQLAVARSAFCRKALSGRGAI